MKMKRHSYKNIHIYEEIVNTKRHVYLIFGRVFGMGSLGLQNLRREVRHTIAHEYYYDIDIVNAHPIIISQIMRQHKIECPCLNKYVKERDDHLNEVMTKYNVDRHTAKELFIIIMYGGGFDRWVENDKGKKIDVNVKSNLLMSYIMK